MFRQFKEPPCVVDDPDDLPPNLRAAGSAFTDVQVARRRFALACIALDVPDDQISAALPGFDPDIPGLRPYNFPRQPFVPELYYFDLDPEKYILGEVKRFEIYIRNQVTQARDRFGKMRIRRPQSHRTRKLDLAERYFITVRRRVLKHSYAEIALDHIRPCPKTEAEVDLAENRLKSVVHVLALAANLPPELG